jgi:hypothetical protein
MTDTADSRLEEAVDSIYAFILRTAEQTPTGTG